MEQKIAEYLEKGAIFAQEFISKHGEQAWEMVKLVYRINAIQHLVIVLIIAILSVAAYKLSRKFWDVYEEKRAKNIYYTGFEVPSVILAGGCMAGAVAVAVMIAHIWYWIGLFYPEAVIAKDVFNRIIGQ